MSRELEENKWVLGFESEESFKQTTQGGPWRHKKDVFIVIPYDEFIRPSAVKFDKLAYG